MIVSCELFDGSHDLSSFPDPDIVLGARIANGDVIPGSGERKCLSALAMVIKGGHVLAVGNCRHGAMRRILHWRMQSNSI
jgi:hypothetical protein